MHYRRHFVTRVTIPTAESLTAGRPMVRHKAVQAARCGPPGVRRDHIRAAHLS